jgi:hypothetical protein
VLFEAPTAKLKQEWVAAITFQWEIANGIAATTIPTKPARALETPEPKAAGTIPPRRSVQRSSVPTAAAVPAVAATAARPRVVAAPVPSKQTSEVLMFPDVPTPSDDLGDDDDDDDDDDDAAADTLALFPKVPSATQARAPIAALLDDDVDALFPKVPTAAAAAAARSIVTRASLSGDSAATRSRAPMATAAAAAATMAHDAFPRRVALLRA